MLRIVLLSMTVLVVGCTQPSTSIKDTVRVCNSAGCGEQATATETRRAPSEPDGPPEDPDAYRGQNVAELEVAARQGDPVANYRLGLVHAFALQGGRPDRARAAVYFRAGAEAGHAGSQYQLGQMYASGQVVAKQPTEALRLFTAAAEAGHPGAAYSLGTMMLEGIGTPRDARGGARWLEVAADAGVPEAQYNLGLLYFRGVGVRQNGYDAMAWLRRAAEHGNADAQTALGKLYLTGYDTVGQDVAEADRWLSAAASQGHPEAVKSLEEVNRLKAENAEFDRYLASRRNYYWRWIYVTPFVTRFGLPLHYRPYWWY